MIYFGDGDKPNC